MWTLLGECSICGGIRSILRCCSVAQKVIAGVYPGVTTVELDVSVTYDAPDQLPNPVLSIEPRRRDCRVPHNKTSRLRNTRRTYCCFKSAQGDQEELFRCHQRSVQLWYVMEVVMILRIIGQHEHL